MCYKCYTEYGKPEILNEATRKAAKLVEGVYEIHGAGGTAHVVVDDFNITDANVQFCLRDSEPGSIEYRCMQAFVNLSEDERASALALYEGWIA